MSIAVLVVGAIAILFLLEWLVMPRRTDPRLLVPSAPVRWWRSYRWVWWRIGCAVLAWPHLVDVVLGTHRTPVTRTAGDVVWKSGSAELQRYRDVKAGTQSVLVVHSLVSKPSILDLTPGSSLVGFLLGAGFEVFLLDWGDPGSGAATRGLSECSDILMEAERQVLALAGSTRVHLVGYCLGGVICLARCAARTHDQVASLTLLATPVDFSVRTGLQPLIRHPMFKPAYFVDGTGCVPAAGLRESFHFLRPRAIRTAIGAWRRRNDEEFRRIYDPLARWVWEHRALPGKVLFDLVDLFRSNSLLEGTSIVSGEMARLEDIRVPVLNAIAERDHIVPSASSRALSSVEGVAVKQVTYDSGHVSMISGTTAKTTTWPEIAEWIELNGRETNEVKG